jgi:hypothetical protein
VLVWLCAVRELAEPRKENVQTEECIGMLFAVCDLAEPRKENVQTGEMCQYSYVRCGSWQGVEGKCAECQHAFLMGNFGILCSTPFCCCKL